MIHADTYRIFTVDFRLPMPTPNLIVSIFIVIKPSSIPLP